MAGLTIENLKKICDRLPQEYEVIVMTPNGEIRKITNTIEVDISNGRLMLKE